MISRLTIEFQPIWTDDMKKIAAELDDREDLEITLTGTKLEIRCLTEDAEIGWLGDLVQEAFDTATEDDPDDDDDVE